MPGSPRKARAVRSVRSTSELQSQVDLGSPQAVASFAHVDRVARHAARRPVVGLPRDEHRARAPALAGSACPAGRAARAGAACRRGAGIGARRVDAERQRVGAHRVGALGLEPVDALVGERERGVAVGAGVRAADGGAGQRRAVRAVGHLTVTGCPVVAEPGPASFSACVLLKASKTHRTSSPGGPAAGSRPPRRTRSSRSSPRTGCRGRRSRRRSG